MTATWQDVERQIEYWLRDGPFAAFIEYEARATLTGVVDHFAGVVSVRSIFTCDQKADPLNHYGLAIRYMTTAQLEAWLLSPGDTDPGYHVHLQDLQTFVKAD